MFREGEHVGAGSGGGVNGGTAAGTPAAATAAADAAVLPSRTHGGSNVPGFLSSRHDAGQRRFVKCTHFCHSLIDEIFVNA